ncbi:hypothetical protein DICPUDRAFT_156403 [Dictyostelium purpureum]|uniref:Battenin n=1 Tax=Dictyostelium purpureum TaxID=5786 RepID=F0ZWH2_DICPU|nr:uncharacterized protein DICPUDRAFT_156403 [Dictyostelium purpureum]EGC31709.1 hypothetical protein DICPUDRAFT_156403 [Dictyostelium purpureum]|eukprot:XP_003291775.1 hypothetical protein DICPUDRAFT_156403 [Dictyostelium purpureum]
MKDYNFIRNWICFNFLGNINNFSYCVVNAAGSSLAAYFNNEKNIALILWANIAFGFVSRLNCIIMGLGLVGVALSVYVNFAFCIASIALIGIASSFGESVLLSYMKRFPAEIVNGWSSGTGVAGVSGSLFYIGMVAAGLSNSKIFYIILPTVGAYFLLFFLGLKVPTASSSPINTKKSSPSNESDKNTEKQSLVSSDQLAEEDYSSPASNIKISDIYDDGCQPIRGTPNETKKQRYIRCAKLVWFNAVNLSLVYFFEYVASVGGADLAIKQNPNGDFFIKNAYAIFSFCYQLGVLISRSSLQFVKIKRVGIITILQGLNMVFWIVQAKYRMVHNVWGLFILMVYCGLLGGASYVNVFYLILHDKKIPDEDREICVNYAALLVTLGITLASCFILVMDHTFLADQVANK